MPDTTGWPTGDEVVAKVRLGAPQAPTSAILAAVPPVLSAVIAEFQSPRSYDGGGGTGRRFVPVTETRTFDGSGYNLLCVDDIVPKTDISVSLWNGNSTPSATLRQAEDGTGSNLLVLIGTSDGYYGGCSPVFPLGVQNVSVQATWGFAATVPADVCEAVLGEVASRILVQGFVPLTGVGEEVKLEDFEINTSSGISVWGQSSPIAVMHTIYMDAIKRYRIGNVPKLKALATSRRMS